MNGRDWKQHCNVCPVVNDTAWYVCYTSGPVRLRLTVRGTWHADDMDIYFKTEGEAYHALETAPKPLADPYAELADLRQQLAAANAKIGAWKAEAFALLADMSKAVRVRQGGGPEDIRASLVVSVIEQGKMLAAANARVGQAEKSAKSVGDNYTALLMAVERKWPDESRHDTALRYIREAETQELRGPAQNTKALDRAGGGGG